MNNTEQINRVTRWTRNEGSPRGPLTPKEFIRYFGRILPGNEDALTKLCVVCKDYFIRPR